MVPRGAVHFVAFLEEQLREIGAVLTGDTDDQSFFHEAFWWEV
jgi:hypothetical protein